MKIASTQRAQRDGEMMKVGCLGLGRLGYQHAKNLATRIPGVTLHAVCDINETWAKEVAAELDVPLVFTRFEDMLEVEEIEAIVIVSPSDQHVEHLRLSLEAGKHVFCEKPLSTDLKSCKEAEAIVESHPDLHFFLGFMRRYDPSYMAAKERIENGSLGRPVMFRGYSQDPIKGIHEALRFSQGSGGIFFDMGVHDIDLARWLLKSEPKMVHSIGENFVEQGFAEFDDYDNASCLMEFEDGTMAYIFVGRTAPHGYNVETEIIGSKEILRIASVPQCNLVEVMDPTGIRRECSQDFLERFSEAYVNELVEFFEGLKNGEMTGPDVYDGTAAALIAEACTVSIREGRSVEIAEIRERFDAI